MTTIKFPLDKNDYLNYHLYISSQTILHPKKLRKRRITIPFLYFIIALLIYLLNKAEISIALLVFAILWFFFYPAYLKKRYVKHFQKHIYENYGHIFGQEIRFELDNDTMHVYDPVSNSTIQNDKIIAIDETLDYYFVRLSPKMGFIFPKANIENLHELKMWLNKITEKYTINREVNLSWKWN